MSCQELSVEQLKQTLFRGTDVQIIDVREVEEYRAGHIEGAELIPLGLVPYRLDEISREREVIVVCHSGNRSKQACQILHNHGYFHVKSLAGGLSSWTA